MSKIIGITGGVGCGKSTVLSILEEKYNASVIQADIVGHLVMKSGNDAFESIVKLFGNKILDELGEIDRKKLGEIVFVNEELLQKLNAIIHPAVKEYIKNFVDDQISKKTEIIVVEAALLIEAGYRDICSEYWYIFASENIRKNRLKASRGYSDEKIIEIMNNQLSEEEFKEYTDFTIDNNSDVLHLEEQIKRLLM
ncbi:MAG: dephospho-CoA kinase [Clostridiales bacterium]|nr:dephospho-CoA kinase [Clostridiales bacterium]